MTGDVIKSFLVGLGFGVDDASLSKFNKALTSATLKVTALYTSTQLAAGGIIAGISKISEGFEQMGYEYRIIAPAINKALLLRRELLKAYSAAGINITKVIQSSVKLNLSLTKTKFAFEAIYKSVASRFFDVLTKQSDAFRKKIYANMPKIQAALERFVKFVFKALDATIQLGFRVWSILTRVFDFFAALDKATDGWSTIILGVIAAWKLLNLSFLATPLGLIITGLVAILALFDDFKTWQEGGESLFDWTTFVPVINSVTAALQSMWAQLKSIVDVVANLALAFYQLFQGDTSGFFESMAAAGRSVLGIFSNLKDTITNLGGALAGLGNWGGKLLGMNPNFNIPNTAPVGSGVQNNNQKNLKLEQQTHINIQGSANAAAIGAAAASEQGRVNQDLARNMKEAAS